MVALPVTLLGKLAANPQAVVLGLHDGHTLDQIAAALDVAATPAQTFDVLHALAASTT